MAWEVVDVEEEVEVLVVVSVVVLRELVDDEDVIEVLVVVTVVVVDVDDVLDEVVLVPVELLVDVDDVVVTLVLVFVDNVVVLLVTARSRMRGHSRRVKRREMTIEPRG